MVMFPVAIVTGLRYNIDNAQAHRSKTQAWYSMTHKVTTESRVARPSTPRRLSIRDYKRRATRVWYSSQASNLQVSPVVGGC